jgi:hypothetical protein
MTAAFYLLLAIGLLGAFDVLYFHTWRGRLQERAECQREVLWHTVRHLIYGLQFLWVPHLRFQGLALGLLAVLYASDVFVAWADVWEERDSRAPQGDLPPRGRRTRGPVRRTSPWRFATSGGLTPTSRTPPRHGTRDSKRPSSRRPGPMTASRCGACSCSTWR